MVLTLEFLLVAGDMGLVVVGAPRRRVIKAFSMLLTFTPSQGGVFIALQKVMGWTHEAE